MTRHLATVLALGLLATACGPAGAHVAGTFSFTSTPPLEPTLAGASPMEIVVCPFEYRAGNTVIPRLLVRLNPQCALRGDEAMLRESAHTTLDPDQICTVPLNGKPAMVIVRNGRANLIGRSAAVEVNIGGITKVDGVDRYVALHFSGDRTTDAAGADCDSYLHPGRPLPP